MPQPCESVEAVCAAAARTAQDQNASLVMVLTETGEAPKMMAKYRPSVPIVAVCPTPEAARQCALLRGVIPIVVEWKLNASEFSRVSVSKVISAALRKVRKMRIADVTRKDFTFNDALSISKGIKKARVIVLHDSDIMDASEMDDWVMRMVDLMPPTRQL